KTHVRSTFRRWRRHSHRRRARPRGDYRPSALGESIRDHLGRRTRGVSRREVHGVCRDVMTMTMRPRLRKFVLTAHVVSSVGWLRAAAAYVVLAVLVLTTRNAQMVRAGIRMMELADLFVIVPLGAASLITGIVQSLGTTWGLFRHYWVVFKLLINVFALF